MSLRRVPSLPAAGEAIIALLAAILATALLDWRSIIGEFHFLPGDRYDAVIVVTILEHWFDVFRGLRRWDDAHYFFPYAKTIAQTDAYFLIGLIYFPFRLSNLDPFLAAHFSNLSLKVVGFLGMFVFGRLVGRWGLWWALAAALIFTFSNGMTSHSQRIQLATIAFAPALATILHFLAIELSKGHRVRPLILGASACLLFGAWCLTCFYMAWFFAYLYLFVAAASIGIGGNEFRANAARVGRASWSTVLLVMAMLAIAVLPFAFTYLSKSLETGVRTYESVLGNLLQPESVLQVGEVNYLFGRLYPALLKHLSPNYIPSGEYYNTGVNPLIFFLFLAAGAYLIMRRAGSRREHVHFLSLFCACVICWVTAMRFGNVSLWWVTYHLIPGAQALNAVSTISLMLAFPVTAIAFDLLDKTTWSKLYVPIFICLALFMAELNHPFQDLDRSTELARVEGVVAAPKVCRSFYVSGWEDQATIPDFVEWINAYYAHNVSAMLIAQLIDLPTVNGIASFNPQDWAFGSPWSPDYDQRVRQYAKKHGILNDLCKLDLNTRQWSGPFRAEQ